MDSWYHSDVTHACMEGLVKCGLLHGRTDVVEWLMPGREDASVPPDGNVVSSRPSTSMDSWFLPTYSFGVCYITIRSIYST